MWLNKALCWTRYPLLLLVASVVISDGYPYRRDARSSPSYPSEFRSYRRTSRKTYLENAANNLETNRNSRQDDPEEFNLPAQPPSGYESNENVLQNTEGYNDPNAQGNLNEVEAPGNGVDNQGDGERPPSPIDNEVLPSQQDVDENKLILNSKNYDNTPPEEVSSMPLEEEHVDAQPLPQSPMQPLQEYEPRPFYDSSSSWESASSESYEDEYYDDDDSYEYDDYYQYNDDIQGRQGGRGFFGDLFSSASSMASGVVGKVKSIFGGGSETADAESTTSPSTDDSSACTWLCNSETVTEAPTGDTPTEASAGDTLTEAPAGDTPTEAPAGDTPTEAPAGDTPTEAPAGDTPTEAPAE